MYQFFVCSLNNHDLCPCIKEIRRSVSILSCIEISTISTFQDNRKMVPALMFVIYLLCEGWNIYVHKAWDHCSIIEGWAVESLNAVINDGSHAFLFYKCRTAGTGREKIERDYYELSLLLLSIDRFNVCLRSKFK